MTSTAVKRRHHRDLNQSWQAYLFLLPAILGLTFITIVPTLGVLGISFTNWNGLVAPKWVGFSNYIKIFTTDYFFKKSASVTLTYALGAVVCSVVYSFLVAMLLNMRVPARSFFRAVFYVPYIVPAMAVYIIWTWMYDPSFGVLNYFLRSIGIPASKWLSAPATALPSLILIAVWGSGNLIVIFLAGLQNVPAVYHEAAKIDGANAIHRFVHITIPMMTPVLFFNFLISVVTQLQTFVPAYSITKGGPSDATMFLVYLIYREGFTHNAFGYSSALSFVFFILVAIITMLIFRFSNSMIFYEGK
ncbi:sugar ABC transporter permease [Clostridia bacterium]|nr:sugar ABC transporter permease [Clostridia bacterium]